MQIEEKYKKDYISALEKFKAELVRLISALSKTEGLRLIPTQANYVTAEIVNGKTAKELTKRMMLGHNILIKDLSGKIKTGEYIRIAIRDSKDNDKLIEAIKDELRR